MELTEIKGAISVVDITNCPLTKTVAVSKNFKLVEQSLAPFLPTKSPPADTPEGCLVSHSPVAPESHQIGHCSTLKHKVSFKSLKSAADPIRPLTYKSC